MVFNSKGSNYYKNSSKTFYLYKMISHILCNSYVRKETSSSNNKFFINLYLI